MKLYEQALWLGLLAAFSTTPLAWAQNVAPAQAQVKTLPKKQLDETLGFNAAEFQQLSNQWLKRPKDP
jgi:hypothetical protein